MGEWASGFAIANRRSHHGALSGPLPSRQTDRGRECVSTRARSGRPPGIAAHPVRSDGGSGHIHQESPRGHRSPACIRPHGGSRSAGAVAPGWRLTPDIFRGSDGFRPRWTRAATTPPGNGHAAARWRNIRDGMACSGTLLPRDCRGTGAARDGRAPRGYGPGNRISRHGTRCRISFPGGAQRIPGTRQPPRRASHVALGTDAVAGGEGVITPMFHFPSLRTGAAAPRAPGAAGGTAGSRTHRPPAAPPVWPPHPVPPSDFLENRTTPGLIKRQHLRPALESRSSPCPKHPVSPAPAHAGGNRHNAPLSA